MSLLPWTDTEKPWVTLIKMALENGAIRSTKAAILANYRQSLNALWLPMHLVLT